jgi:signal transduction histidine kinase
MIAHDPVNILLVDDQPAKLVTYEAILQDLGENLITAGSARQALEHILKKSIAVILIDVCMPELDGFELAEMIRQHPRYQKTAIIFISAVHLTDLDRLKGYQRGAVDYISVPVVPELLLAKVSVFAELHRKTRELQMLNDELRRLSASLITTQDEERRRIARELHDGLGQDLVAAKMTLNPILQKEIPAQLAQQTASDANLLIDNAIQKVRSMTHLLHPPMLEEIGLHSALQWFLEGFSKRSSIETSIDVRPADFPRLPAGLETAVFRIVQEALTNVFRHSGAGRAWVRLMWEERRVIATVRDDGKGISDRIAEFQPASVGIGIGGMRQRVKEFGGELCLRNVFPGTLVEVVIPVKSEPQTPESSTFGSRNQVPAEDLSLAEPFDSEAGASRATGNRLSTS